MPLESAIGAGDMSLSEQSLLVREQEAFQKRNRRETRRIRIVSGRVSLQVSC